MEILSHIKKQANAPINTYQAISCIMRVEYGRHLLIGK